MVYRDDIKSAYCERDNLGDIVKRQHCELIKLWAEGATIQYFNRLSRKWSDVANNGPTWSPFDEYRVKPETVRYRVALMQSHGSKSAICVHNNAYHDFIQDDSHFVRWLTPWQEVEV